MSPPGAARTPEAAARAYHRALRSPARRLQQALKRALDLAVATLVLVGLSPLLALVALWVRLDSSGPVLFRQRRLGRWGRPFTMYKLRTMVHGAPMHLNPDGSSRVVDGDRRLTRAGRLLRRLGLDELPQLVNVLRGEMSLVGPRPDHVFQRADYRSGDYGKLAMRPGITSLAQVSGRNSLPWRERVALEVEYVERFSLWLDLQIACRTLGVVVRGTGLFDPALPEGADRPRPRGVKDAAGPAD
jgi:lipopolysaccharide/colanic/teichoic acid biosynthesis glycosyltransferase